MARKKILIVEDQVIVALTIESLLNDAGYDTIGPIREGEEVMDALKKNETDLILMDIILDGKMNGIEVANQVNEKYDIPIIFLTASSSDGIFKQAKEANPFGFINKPFEDNDLIKRIDLAIHKHHTEKELRKSELLNKALLENIPDTILVVDNNEQLIKCNHEKLEDYLLKAKSEYIGEKLEAILPSEIYTPIKQTLNEAEDKNIPIDFNSEIKLFYLNEIKYVEIRVFKTSDQETIIILRDITDKEIKNERLNMLSQAIEQSHEMIMITNTDGVIEYINPSFTEITGYQLSEAIGKKHSFIKSNEHSTEEFNKIKQELAENSYYKTQFTNIKKSGEQFVEEKTIKPIKDKKGNTVKYLSISSDITEKIEINKTLEKLKEEDDLKKTKELLLGQDIERKRLSKDLHDGIGQILSVTKRKLAEVEKAASKAKYDDELRNKFTKAVNYINDVISDVRKISQNLMPTVLEDFGIKAALNKLCNSSSTDSIEVNFSFSGKDIRLGENAELMLYRIAQEAINNSLKHSKATTVNVMLEIDSPKQYRLIVADDGDGFKLDEERNLDKGSGLGNIKERSKILNGQLCIESNKKSGTVISLTINENE